MSWRRLGRSRETRASKSKNLRPQSLQLFHCNKAPPNQESNFSQSTNDRLSNPGKKAQEPPNSVPLWIENCNMVSVASQPKRSEERRHSFIFSSSPKNILVEVSDRVPLPVARSTKSKPLDVWGVSICRWWARIVRVISEMVCVWISVPFRTSSSDWSREFEDKIKPRQERKRTKHSDWFKPKTIKKTHFFFTVNKSFKWERRKKDGWSWSEEPRAWQCIRHVPFCFDSVIFYGRQTAILQWKKTKLIFQRKIIQKGNLVVPLNSYYQNELLFKFLKPHDHT